MKLLFALDSRPSNQAALGVLDPHTAAWEQFETMKITEPFLRRGFRGATLVDDRLYVLSSAALYIYRWNFGAAGNSLVELEKTVRRPEWEVGARAAADLHHVHYSPQRKRLFIANSFMDAVDEISLDGEFIAHHYLWDLSPAIAEVAKERNPAATDLVHVNHISEQGGRIYLTLGNWNGTRTGKIVCFDTGEIVLEDLEFPHDGFVHDGDLYISATGASQVLIYENAADMNLLGRRPDHVLPVEIRQDQWRNSFQWVRGIHVTDRHIVCGVTQWRNETIDQPQIPPRLVFFDRTTKKFQGELFFPSVEGFPSPSIFSLIPLPDERGDSFDYSLWERETLLSVETEPSAVAVHEAHQQVDSPHCRSMLGNGTGIWPGTWTPYSDPGVEEQAGERVVGIVLPEVDATNQLMPGWSCVDRESNQVEQLAKSLPVVIDDQVIFYTGHGYRNSRPRSGSLPGQHFLQLRLTGYSVENAKLGCDLYCWHGKDKKPLVQELGQIQLTNQPGEYNIWTYLAEPASKFRLVFRMYQPLQVVVSDLHLGLYATLPEKDRLGAAETAHTEPGESPRFPHLNLLPRWMSR